MKQTKKDYICLDSDDLEDYLQDVIDYLGTLLAKYGDNAIIQMDGTRGLDIYLNFEREENDEEYSRRLEQEEIDKEFKAMMAKSKEEADYELYLQLKEKFG